MFPWGSPEILADPASLPPGGSDANVAWSPNGEYLSYGVDANPVFLLIYQRTGNTFTKLSDPTTLPTDAVFGTAWSSNGEFLATAHVSAPFVTIYQRTGNTFDKLTDLLHPHAP